MPSTTFNLKVAGAVSLGMIGGLVLVHSQRNFIWDAIQFLGTDDYLVGLFFLLAGAGIGCKLYYDQEIHSDLKKPSPQQPAQPITSDEKVVAHGTHIRSLDENDRFNRERMGYLLACLACIAQGMYAFGTQRIDPLHDPYLPEQLEQEWVMTLYGVLYGITAGFGVYCFLKAWGWWPSYQQHEPSTQQTAGYGGSMFTRARRYLKVPVGGSVDI